MSDSQPARTGGGLTAMNGYWAASALFIVFVIVGVVVVILTGGPDPATAPAPMPTTTSGVPTAPATADADADAEQLMSAPPTEWQLFYDVALPTSPTAGPAVQDGRLWSGYERTPEGALMAAAYLLAATDAPEAATVMERQVVAGPAATAYENELSVSPPQPPTPGMTPVLAGFRFANYSDDEARVEFVFTAQEAAASIPVALTWQDGDWKMNFEQTGGQPALTPIQSTAGFVLWSPA